MICIRGSVDVYMNDGKSSDTVTLNQPTQCLIIEPEDWHEMLHFSKDCVLLVLADASFDRSDYIMERYP